MTDKRFVLSAIVITGNEKFTRSESAEALKSQSIADEMEIIIVKFQSSAKSSEAEAETATGPFIREIRMEKGQTLIEARLTGLRQARGAIVAFIEDHCVPGPDWAEWLIEAHRKPNRAIGYAFTSGSPDTLLYRSIFFAEYGLWSHPAVEGPIKILPGNNISYRKKDLWALRKIYNTGLKEILFFPEKPQQYGLKLFMEPKAKVAHQSCKYLKDVYLAHFYFGRVLGAARAKGGQWSNTRRTLYAMSVPLFVPTLQVYRICLHLRKQLRPPWTFFLTSIPLVFCLFQVGAFGEFLGYILGSCSVERTLDKIEIHAPRIGLKR